MINFKYKIFPKHFVNGIIKTLLKENPHLTIDEFFVDGCWRNDAKLFIEDMKKQGSTQIDYVDGVFGGSDVVCGKIIELLEKRMKHSQITESLTNGVKEKLIKSSISKVKDIMLRSID